MKINLSALFTGSFKHNRQGLKFRSIQKYIQISLLGLDDNTSGFLIFIYLRKGFSDNVGFLELHLGKPKICSDI